MEGAALSETVTTAMEDNKAEMACDKDHEIMVIDDKDVSTEKSRSDICAVLLETVTTVDSKAEMGESKAKMEDSIAEMIDSKAEMASNDNDHEIIKTDDMDFSNEKSISDLSADISTEQCEDAQTDDAKLMQSNSQTSKNLEPPTEEQDRMLIIQASEVAADTTATIDSSKAKEQCEVQVVDASLEDHASGQQAGQVDEGMEIEQLDAQIDEYIPQINYSFTGQSLPGQLAGAWQEFEYKSGNFLKGCKWSPDGSCLLTNSNDNVLRLFNLPNEFYTGNYDELTTEMGAVLRMQEGETVYDYCWYPHMSSMDPDTCCLLSTCRDHPVHMWDAFTGKLRCSYKSYNNMDEITSATSVAFNLDGTKIYCGFNKMVRVFDTDRPGRNYEERPTVVKKQGQSGLISCIAFSPGLYALGSYSKSVGIYSEDDGELLCLLQGQVGGVTHVVFSPDGTKLYSGGRKDDEILCWDVRNPGTVLYRLVRSVGTNQRIYFDLDRQGRYLVSGSVDGTITVWDTTSSPVYADGSCEPVLPPLLSYTGHGDCINGISFHPSLPLLATASGQRKFSLPNFPDDDSDEETADQQEVMLEDNSVRLWRI